MPRPDVIRAGESLARADRLSSYWGSGEDVQHYAYLSQRYSAIAREHSNQVLNEERATKLELERQRLQLALRESVAECPAAGQMAGRADHGDGNNPD